MQGKPFATNTETLGACFVGRSTFIPRNPHFNSVTDLINWYFA